MILDKNSALFKFGGGGTAGKKSQKLFFKQADKEFELAQHFKKSAIEVN